MKVSFFETGRYRGVARPAARMAGAARRLRPGARRPGVSGHGRARPLCREARLRLDQPVRAPLFAAHPDPVATAVGRLPGEPGRYDQDRAVGSDRAGQQPDPGRRGVGDARHDASGPLRVRSAARHHQRISQLRSEPEGGARAHRRGDGADPQGVERAAAVRLAGALFQVPHRLDLAAAADPALSDHLRARGQRRGGRFRGPAPHRARRLLRHGRADGAGRPAITGSAAPNTAGSRGRTTSSGAPT